MKINIVPIGNSKGIRLPKNILTECNINDEIYLEIDDGKIILSPITTKSRKNWDLKFKEMNKNKDDTLIIDDSINIEMDDWEW